MSKQNQIKDFPQNSSKVKRVVTITMGKGGFPLFAETTRSELASTR